MSKRSNKIAHTRRIQLDRALARLDREALLPPTRGWVRAIREALGMNGRQLAQRMRVAPSHVSHIEQGESGGNITIKTLRRAADALDCELVYALVPRAGSLEQSLHLRARQVAIALVDRVDAHMALEHQQTSDEARQRLIESTADDLIRTLDKRIWEPDR